MDWEQLSFDNYRLIYSSVHNVTFRVGVKIDHFMDITYPGIIDKINFVITSTTTGEIVHTINVPKCCMVAENFNNLMKMVFWTDIKKIPSEFVFKSCGVGWCMLRVSMGRLFPVR